MHDDHSHSGHSHESHSSHHHHSHSPHSHTFLRSEKNKKRLWLVLGLSSSYMVAEIVGGWLSGSLALLADAGHMAIDTAAIALGLFAIWIAQRPPTEEKTFGYYRAEILAALVNGATLVAVSCWIFYESWHRFQAPVSVRGEMMTGVAAGGLVVNLVGLWLTHQGSQESLNVRGVWLHLIADTLGSVSALIAGVLVWKFDWQVADPVVSGVLALFILVGSFRLLSECVNVLLEGVPKGTSVGAIRQDIASVARVKNLHDLHVWMLASGVVALSAHVRIEEGADGAAVLSAITEMLKEKHSIEHSTIQLETAAFSHSPDPLECQRTS